MKVLLLSRWSTPIIYDLYCFLSSLKSVVVYPCSFLSNINSRVRIDELNKKDHYYIRDGINADRVNRLCNDLGIDIVCVSWLTDIKILLPILNKINRKILLFPHGEDIALRKVAEYDNCYLIHKSSSNLARSQFEWIYFVSRRFVNKKKNPVLDGSIIFAGESNIGMQRKLKISYLKFIKTYLRKYRITMSRFTLYSLYPFRFYFSRRVIYKVLRMLGHDLYLERRLRTKLNTELHFDKYFTDIRSKSNFNFVEKPIPYEMFCNEIAKHSFVEVTPSAFSSFLPWRAATALASGTPLLLRKDYCPPLEAIIKEHHNGYIYEDISEVENLIEKKEFVKELCANATKYRYDFTLESHSKQFLNYVDSLLQSQAIGSRTESC